MRNCRQGFSLPWTASLDRLPLKAKQLVECGRDEVSLLQVDSLLQQSTYVFVNLTWPPCDAHIWPTPWAKTLAQRF